MTKNKFQEKLTAYNTFMNLPSLENLNLQYINKLSSTIGQSFNSDATSNIYLLANQHNLDLLNMANTMLDILNGMNEFFDYNRFDGYQNGTYSGLRIALLELSLFDDVKIVDTNANATVQIVLLSKAEYSDNITNIFKLLIAQKIHENIAFGIKTLSNENAVSQEITASTGQNKTYNWNMGSRRSFNIHVDYIVDFEQNFTNYDFNTQIKDVIAYVYKNNYGYLGKDVIIQDFFAITQQILGIKQVSITFNSVEVNENNEPNLIVKDANIPIDITEIFDINSITATQIDTIA